MAINFSEKNTGNRQKILIVVFVLIILAIILVWMNNSAKNPPVAVEQVPSRGVAHLNIEIDFDFLGGKILSELQLPEEIKAFEGETGRENPFIPY